MNPTDRRSQERINEIEEQKISAESKKIKYEVEKLKLEIKDFRCARTRSVLSTIVVPILVAATSITILASTGWFNAQSALIANKQRDLDSVTSQFAVRDSIYKKKDSIYTANLKQSLKSLTIIDSLKETNKRLDADLTSKNFSRDSGLTNAYTTIAKLRIKNSLFSDSLAQLKRKLSTINQPNKDLTDRLYYLEGELYERDELIKGLQGQLTRKN